MSKRGPGRPRHEVGTVGAQKIIDRIREAIISNKSLDLSRKNMASTIGVTPALITYYFTDINNLLEQVVTPIIESYRQSISRTINSPADRSEKLRLIISTLADLYGKDSGFLNIYQKFENHRPDDYSECRAITSILSEFFEEREGAQASSIDAAALHGAVRGMCDLAERAGAQAASGGAELIYQLFAHDHGASAMPAVIPPTDIAAAT